MSRPRLLLAGRAIAGAGADDREADLRGDRRDQRRSRAMTVLLVEQNAFHALQSRASRLCHGQRGKSCCTGSGRGAARERRSARRLSGGGRTERRRAGFEFYFDWPVFIGVTLIGLRVPRGLMRPARALARDLAFARRARRLLRHCSRSASVSWLMRLFGTASTSMVDIYWTVRRRSPLASIWGLFCSDTVGA